MTITQTLKQARAQAGYTQQFIANELGISRPTYVKIENDPSVATIAQAKRICTLLSKNYENIFLHHNVS